MPPRPVDGRRRPPHPDRAARDPLAALVVPSRAAHVRAARVPAALAEGDPATLPAAVPRAPEGPTGDRRRRVARARRILSDPPVAPACRDATDPGADRASDRRNRAQGGGPPGGARAPRAADRPRGVPPALGRRP